MLLSRNISLLIILGVLNSCGFQLRQPVLLPVSMNQTYIETSNNRSLFYQQLKKELVSKDIELVSSKADASSILKIFEDETGRRVLSVSARSIATEYEVFYRIVFGLEEAEKLLSPPREIILTRSYFNEKLVLGKSQEEEMLIEALASDLVRITLNQLSSK